MSNIATISTIGRDPSIEVVTFKREPQLSFDPSGQNSIDKPFVVRGLPGNFEAKTDVQPGSRRDWKRFEHYLLNNEYSKFHVPAYHDTREWTGVLNDTGDPYHWAIHNDPYYGCKVLYGDAGFSLTDLPSLYDPDDDEKEFIPPPPNLNELVSRSLKTMLPNVRAELSSVNSLIELKDVVSIRSTVTNVLGFVRNIPRSVKFLRELLRVGSDVYLQKSFNIDPLLSDISGIYSALTRIERRINQLLSRAGKGIVRHYRMTLPDGRSAKVEWAYDAGSIPPRYLDPRLGGTCFNKVNVQVYPSIFHAQIEYCYNFTQYQREHARLLGLLDALGVNLNPSIIWNALPWSFVVDWVLSVNSWLNSFAIANMEPQINIRRYLWSVTYRRVRTHVISYNMPFAGISCPHPTYEIPLCTTYETAYKREVGLPSPSQLSAGGLSLKEVTLGAALILSRKRRRRNR